MSLVPFQLPFHPWNQALVPDFEDGPDPPFRWSKALLEELKGVMPSNNVSPLSEEEDANKIIRITAIANHLSWKCGGSVIPEVTSFEMQMLTSGPTGQFWTRTMEDRLIELCLGSSSWRTIMNRLDDEFKPEWVFPNATLIQEDLYRKRQEIVLSEEAGRDRPKFWTQQMEKRLSQLKNVEQRWDYEIINTLSNEFPQLRRIEETVHKLRQISWRARQEIDIGG